MLQNHSKIVVQNGLFASDDDRNGYKIDILDSLFNCKHALPNPHNVKQFEILSIEQSDPPKTIEKRIDFQLLESVPNQRLNDLYSKVFTTNI